MNNPIFSVGFQLNEMTYIEGIGDEVIECLIVLVIIVFATLAWWSTSTSDRPLMRTVYIVALHGRSASENGQPVGLTEAQNGMFLRSSNVCTKFIKLRLTHEKPCILALGIQ